MKNAFNTITGWIGDITDLLSKLLVLGIVIGILFNDYFGVIGGIGALMAQFGDAGLAGLLALVLIVTWYNK